MNVFAFADMVGQILQQNSRFLPVFLSNRAGKRVDFGGGAFSRISYPARCLFVHRHQFLRKLNLAMIGGTVNVLRLANVWPGASAYPLHKKPKADIVSARLCPLGCAHSLYPTSTVTFRLAASPTNHFFWLK